MGAGRGMRRRSSVNSSARGIRRHGFSRSVGYVVKPTGAKSKIQKPSNIDLTEGDWIYVRGCRIKRDGLRFNSQGDVYVPDSEEDEVAPEVDVAPVVTAEGVAGVEMNPKVAGRLAKKVLGEDLHPKVAAHLAEVLSKMEPLYHECFIDMYKFRSPPTPLHQRKDYNKVGHRNVEIYAMHSSMFPFIEILGLTLELIDFIFFEEMNLIFLKMMDFVSLLIRSFFIEVRLRKLQWIERFGVWTIRSKVDA